MEGPSCGRCKVSGGGGQSSTPPLPANSVSAALQKSDISGNSYATASTGRLHALPGETYTVRGHIRGSPGATGYLYVKNHGRGEVRSESSTDTTYDSVALTFARGRNRTSAEVGVRITSPGELWLDDLEITSAAPRRAQVNESQWSIP